jgi:P-type Ca2+ transporter type 2C
LNHTGLHPEEARRRLSVHGANELPRADGPSALSLFVGQFHGAMTWLLAFASIVALALGEGADALAIAVILLLNAAIGFFQESRAMKAVQALRSLTAPRARVLRGTASLLVAAREIVPGDILLLEAGDLVPADARLIEAHALRTAEAALTGESTPVDKDASPAPPGAPLADRHDHVFLGTAVAAGRGVAEVVATGGRTELGRVARLLDEAESGPTPLARQLEGLGRTLMALCLAIVALVFVLGLLRGLPFVLVLLTSVSLAVAAVPEGLPAIVTIALALGVQRMAKRHAIVRRLASVETMGCATVVCTDKTGTLTTGRMELRELRGPDEHALLFAAAACSDAEWNPEGGVGDPTELALLQAAAARGILRPDIERERPRIDEQPFDSRRRRMSVARADGRMYVKGAPEVVLALCPAAAPEAAPAAAEMAARGLRVLAVAIGSGREETGLEFLGLAGLADPPRPGVAEAVARARRAGIRTVMVTGDHAATAEAIAREIGILGPDDEVSEAVSARVTAEEKIAIVRSFKSAGEVVAMTGDGVNDAPALREAHIGIAMGRSGTEVAREAADVVLTDDDFSTIVAAIEEGRGLYDNIRKSVVYLLAGNVSELLLVLVATALGLPLPLLPLHLLWTNLVTDGLPALALVMDPPAPGSMARPPRPREEPLIGRRQWRRILSISLLEGSLVLATFAWALGQFGLGRARGYAFFTLVFCELFRAFAARSSRLLHWQVGTFTNLPLIGVIAASVLLQLSLLHLPFARARFDLELMSALDAFRCLALGLVPVSILELAKLLRRAPRAR